jgi:hypothetical protein
VADKLKHEDAMDKFREEQAEREEAQRQLGVELYAQSLELKAKLTTDTDLAEQLRYEAFLERLDEEFLELEKSYEDKAELHRLYMLRVAAYETEGEEKGKDTRDKYRVWYEGSFGKQLAAAEKFKAIDGETTEEAEQRKKEATQATYQAMLSGASDMFYMMAQHNKKWFKFYQATKIMEIIIATSLAAMRAYSDAGPFAGSVLAAMIVALGAAQVAMVASQQPPSYAKGGVVHKPTMALIGEGAKSEAVVPLDSGQEIPVNFRGEGGPMGGGITVNISALDSKSFIDMTRRNPKAIIDPIMRAMQRGDKALISTMRRVT